MSTREFLWLQLSEALPPLPDGWWRVEPVRAHPVRRVLDALGRWATGNQANPADVVAARFIGRGGHPSPELVLVGSGSDEVAALQDLLARVKKRYPDKRLVSDER